MNVSIRRPTDFHCHSRHPRHIYSLTLSAVRDQTFERIQNGHYSLTEIFNCTRTVELSLLSSQNNARTNCLSFKQSFHILNKWMNVGPVAAALVRYRGHIYVNELSCLTDVELLTFSNSKSSSGSVTVWMWDLSSSSKVSRSRQLTEEPKLPTSKDY